VTRDLPNDLSPLPTVPWEERPDHVPLDQEEVRTALWLNDGNVSTAANQLKVTSRRLRAFIGSSPYLLGEAQEAREQLVDRAEDIVREALESEPTRADPMARYVLSSLGRTRGFGTQSNPSLKVDSSGPILIQWLSDNPPSATVDVVISDKDEAA
jgi:hypothetical protein